MSISADGLGKYQPAKPHGGLPKTFGSGDSCKFPGVRDTYTEYTVPGSPPSGVTGSLYRIRLKVTDQAGNRKDVLGDPFYIVQHSSDPVRTLIITNMEENASLRQREEAARPQLKGTRGPPARPRLVPQTRRFRGFKDSLRRVGDLYNAGTPTRRTLLFGCPLPNAKQKQRYP